jgi:hypothetical protein
MSETVPTESSSATHVAEAWPESDAEDPAAAQGASKLSRWAALAALPIAVIAIAVAAAGWFYPHKSASSAPSFTDQQTKDAKEHVCAAFVTVDRAVVRNTHLKNPPDGGPGGALAVATNARLALYGGGAYLRDRLTLEPATPPDLAKPVGLVATTLQELGMNYLASAPGFAQDELRHNLDAGIKTVAQRCK